MEIIPISYLIKHDNISIYDGIKIELRGENSWAIYDSGMVLNVDGILEWEPSPSNRDEEFIKRTRFESPESALDVYKKYFKVKTNKHTKELDNKNRK